jgi:hypothetical protein
MKERYKKEEIDLFKVTVCAEDTGSFLDEEDGAFFKSFIGSFQ